MTQRKKFSVQCTIETQVEEWVFANTPEEAMQVIKDNFLGLTPVRAVELKEKEEWHNDK